MSWNGISFSASEREFITLFCGKEENRKLEFYMFSCLGWNEIN